MTPVNKLIVTPVGKNSSTRSGYDYPGQNCLLEVFLDMGHFGIHPVLGQGPAPTHVLS